MDLYDLIKLISQMVKKYPSDVVANYINPPEPFFNENNTPLQWLGKVMQDTKTRGPYEGLQDLFNPLLQNKYVYPFAEPLVGNLRVLNYKAGNPNQFINSILGQKNNFF